MNDLIMLSSHGGGLSKALSEIIKTKKKKINTNRKLLISTYSPTLKKESLDSYQEEIKYYRKLIIRYMQTHSKLPGITGLAQINGARGETNNIELMKKRVKYDIEYNSLFYLILILKP